MRVDEPGYDELSAAVQYCRVASNDRARRGQCGNATAFDQDIERLGRGCGIPENQCTRND